MSVFSTNLAARQVFVGTNIVNDPKLVKKAGDLYVAKDFSLEKGGLGYVISMSAGGPTRSDTFSYGFGITDGTALVPNKVISIKKTTADQMKRYQKAVNVRLVDSKVYAGQNYILRIELSQYLGISDEHKHFKYADVLGTGAMKPAQFYTELAISLWRNLSKEVTPLFRIFLGGVEIKGVAEIDGKIYPINDNGEKVEGIATGVNSGLTIVEADQPWTLGREEQVPVYFDVYTEAISNGEESYRWGDITVNQKDEKYVIKNGRTVADLEYFYHGERGDQYRGVGFPNIIDTKYLVDPDKEYDIYDVNYAFFGDGETPQRSEKAITVIVPAGTKITQFEAAQIGG